MSDDSISRQAAIDALDEQIKQCDKALSSFDISLKDEFAVKVERTSLCAYREALEQLPPAPEKTARWELRTYLPHNNYCTHCGKDSPYNKRWEHCPHCGAHMIEEEQ